MSTIEIRNKSSHKAQWIAFAVTVSILAFVAYTSHKDDVVATPIAWTADSSWKGGWNE